MPNLTVRELTLLATFKYFPSVPAAGAFIAIFAIVFLVSLGQFFKFGKRYMMFLHGMAFMETIGYGLRILAEKDPTLVNIMLSNLFILIAPTFLQLLNFIFLGNLLVVAEKSMSLGHRFITIPPNRFGRVFFAMNYLCLLPQTIGGILFIVGVDPTIASTLIKIGLCLQLAVACLFITVLYRIMHKDVGLTQVPSLRPMFICIVSTVALLFIRTIYRLLLVFLPSTSEIPRTEWVFYVFDSGIVLTCFILFNVFHYGRILELRSESPKWIEEFHALKAGKPLGPLAGKVEDEDKPSDV